MMQSVGVDGEQEGDDAECQSWQSARVGSGAGPSAGMQEICWGRLCLLLRLNLIRACTA